MKKRLRIGVTAGVTAAMIGLSAAPALANWSSFMRGVGTGFQSRSWNDGYYSQVLFMDCNSKRDISTDVELRQERSLWPDVSWGEQRYSGCFGGGTSNGEWRSLDKGSHFFQINQIDDGTTLERWAWLSVEDIYQDTTAAD